MHGPEKLRLCLAQMTEMTEAYMVEMVWKESLRYEVIASRQVGIIKQPCHQERSI